MVRKPKAKPIPAEVKPAEVPPAEVKSDEVLSALTDNASILLEKEKSRQMSSGLWDEDRTFCHRLMENGYKVVPAINDIYKGLTPEQAKQMAVMKLQRIPIRLYLLELLKPIEDKIKLCTRRAFVQLMEVVDHGKNEQAKVKACLGVMSMGGYSETIIVEEHITVKPGDVKQWIDMIQTKRRELEGKLN